ncbi:uncharacterized protein LOC119958957 isoform X1 [Scyliorhinus canicula]|uniref:uncharacterized protein LOC119958957 isoform X1 n=1 Tax=Scyliorhinus canicula TaxID=7830 RepID=UPI0018F404EC|nr:uncharacterized protein LOC119958957 isoform X1 [Scyliorhinus canicula]
MDLSKHGPNLTAFVSPETDTEQDKTTEISTESTVPQVHSEKHSKMDSAKRRLLAAKSDGVRASHKKTSSHRKPSMRRYSLQWSNTGSAIDPNAVQETEIEQDKIKLAVYKKTSRKRFSLDLSKYRPSLTSITSVETEMEHAEVTENFTWTAHDITDVNPETRLEVDKVKHQKHSGKQLSSYKPSLTSIASVESDKDPAEVAENVTLTVRDITEEYPGIEAAADEVEHEESGQQEQKGLRKRFSLDLSMYRPSLTAIASVESETEENPETQAAADKIKHEESGQQEQKGSRKRFSLDLSMYRPSFTAIAIVESETEAAEAAENSTLTARDITEEHPETQAAADKVKHEKGSRKRFSLDLSMYRPSLTAIASVESETEENHETQAAADEVKHEESGQQEQKGLRKRFSLDLSMYRPSLTAIASVESETEENPETQAAADKVKHEESGQQEQKGLRKRFSLDLSMYRPSLTAIASVESETEENPETQAAADKIKHEESGQQEQKGLRKRFSLDLSMYRPSLTAIASSRE